MPTTKYRHRYFQDSVNLTYPWPCNRCHFQTASAGPLLSLTHSVVLHNQRMSCVCLFPTAPSICRTWGANLWSTTPSTPGLNSGSFQARLAGQPLSLSCQVRRLNIIIVAFLSNDCQLFVSTYLYVLLLFQEMSYYFHLKQPLIMSKMKRHAFMALNVWQWATNSTQVQMR